MKRIDLQDPSRAVALRQHTERIQRVLDEMEQARLEAERAAPYKPPRSHARKPIVSH